MVFATMLGKGTLRQWVHLLVAMVAVTLLACSGAGTEADLPPSTRFFSRMFVMPATSDFLWVVVVDDRDDPEAAVLRSNVKAAFSAYLKGFVADHDASSSSRDVWLSVNMAAIVVHPSLTGDERWTGPDDDPALRWETPDANAAGARIFADAFARAVDKGPAPPRARYQMLDAYRQVVSILSKCVEPHGRRETILAEMPVPGASFLFSVVDDDSTEPAATYIDATAACERLTATHARLFVPGVVPEDGGRCAQRATADWRLLALEPFFLDSTYQACDGVAALTSMFAARLGGGFGRSNCLARPLTVRDDGLAACTLRVVHAQPVGCPPSRGWFDPPTADGGSGPTFLATAQGERRVCEVRQLDGEEGTTCRSGAACPDCRSGFCPLTVDAMKWCSTGGYRADLRVVGGALLGPLEGHLTCMMEP